MLRMFKLFCAMTMVALVLAACGGGATPPGGETGSQPTAAAGGEPTAATGGEPTAATGGEPTAASGEGSTSGASLVLWTKEGEADGGLQFVRKLAEEFGSANGLTIEVVNKEVEALRTDFVATAVAGSGPDLLWTVNDHAGPFTIAGLLQSIDQTGLPTEGLVQSGIDATSIDGQVWGLPITAGNQLLLLYNKKLLPEAPKTTEELIAKAKEISSANEGTYGLVYNQTEPFWMVPWLGGFGGQVFAEDGKTPNLNSPEMVQTLEFVKQLKDEGVVPAESDYNTADSLFQEGKAAMIVNGDWSLAQYSGATASTTATANVDLGVAPLPDVTATGQPAAPYTSGTYFMFPATLEGEKLDIAKKFVEYVISPEVQERMATELKRLPALQSALESDVVTNDPVLAGAAAALPRGTGMPAVAEMRCNWDAMKSQLQAVLAGQMEPQAAAEEMQASAETCVADLQ